jgi:hypothetical protein
MTTKVLLMCLTVAAGKTWGYNQQAGIWVNPMVIKKSVGARWTNTEMERRKIKLV